MSDATGSFFDYAAAGGRPDDKDKAAPKKPSHDKGGKKDDKKNVVRTQMVGESPDEDIGYDPRTIPTEKI